MVQKALTGSRMKMKLPSGSLRALTGSKGIKLPNQAKDNHCISQTATTGSIHCRIYHRKLTGLDVLVGHYTVKINTSGWRKEDNTLSSNFERLKTTSPQGPFSYCSGAFYYIPSYHTCGKTILSSNDFMSDVLTTFTLFWRTRIRYSLKYTQSTFSFSHIINKLKAHLGQLELVIEVNEGGCLHCVTA